jgi:EAL domain-containing protein (putative c-di-GMP-specific phosphodiesterase class I)
MSTGVGPERVIVGGLTRGNGVTMNPDLPGAAARGEIEAFFQPQFDLADLSGPSELSELRIVAVESLSRWRHPFRGIVSPLEFIPDAEAGSEIHAVGAFMLIDSCRSAARWAGQGTPIQVSVNVSARQLDERAFFDEVAATLERTPLDPGLLTLEITESLAIVDRAVALAGLDRLRALGVDISIDDFGTGHSSLEQLTSLPFTELKIDKSLVQSAADDDAIAAIVERAHARRIRVVAEGIETEEQLDRARRLGCDRAQGFLLGHPVPENEMDEILAAALKARR